MLKPLRYKVGGPSEVYASSGAAVFLCGMNRKDIRCWLLATCWDCRLWERRDTINTYYFKPALQKSCLWERKDTNKYLQLWGRIAGGLLMGAQRPMLDAVMIILFIRLWIGSTLERFPLGLWRKSCDHHWHLMNDHNDRDYHLWWANDHETRYAITNRYYNI